MILRPPLAGRVRWEKKFTHPTPPPSIPPKAPPTKTPPPGHAAKPQIQGGALAKYSGRPSLLPYVRHRQNNTTLTCIISRHMIAKDKMREKQRRRNRRWKRGNHRN